MSNFANGAKERPAARGVSFAAFMSLGFRPFFLGAAVFAIVAIGLWVVSLRVGDLIAPGYGMASWHMHEMLFGYGPAVLSGFLLTAVPNWTGRKPLKGTGLGLLFVLWLAGRIVMMAPVPTAVMVAVDVAFLPVIALVMLREIAAARNWRNLMVLGPIGLFALANGVFHFEVLRDGVADYGVRLGLGALIFLVMLIGGRIIPAFTRNWLVNRGSDLRPVAFNRFDGVTLVGTVVALLLWVSAPVGLVTALALGASAILHLVRLSRWRGLATLREPLLFVLHAAYAVIPVGIVALALGAGLDDWAAQVAGIHLLGIGAIGGMTMAVMIRASLGHTGSALKADMAMKAGMVCLFAAAVIRAGAGFADDATMWIDLSAGLWVAGFAMFVLRIGPSLLKPRPGAAQG